MKNALIALTLAGTLVGTAWADIPAPTNVLINIDSSCSINDINFNAVTANSPGILSAITDYIHGHPSPAHAKVQLKSSPAGTYSYQVIANMTQPSHNNGSTYTSTVSYDFSPGKQVLITFPNDFGFRTCNSNP